MNKLDQVCKETRIFLDHAKDTLMQRLVDVSRNQNLSEDQLKNVSNTVLLTLEESYQKVLPHYQSKLKAFVKE